MVEEIKVRHSQRSLRNLTILLFGVLLGHIRILVSEARERSSLHIDSCGGALREARCQTDERAKRLCVVARVGQAKRNANQMDSSEALHSSDLNPLVGRTDLAARPPAGSRRAVCGTSRQTNHALRLCTSAVPHGLCWCLIPPA